MKRRHAGDLRALGKLAVTATVEVTDVVESMHATIASGPSVLGKPLAGPARLLTRLAYAPTKAITKMVGVGLDALLARLDPWLGESVPGPQRDAFVAALNGVLGDTLFESENALAIETCFRHGGRTLGREAAHVREAIPDATTRLLVLIHGSSMNDRQWTRNGHDHGAALAADLGLTPVYLLYNSGRHVAQNGAELARRLEELSAMWPVPLEQIVLLGHSMGGLVARSACHVAEEESLSWRTKLSHLVTLGTPHHGAPLERAGNMFHALLGITAYSAPIARVARIRSAGVTDLRFGNVLDEGTADRFAFGTDSRSPLPLPSGVRCFAVAGTTASEMRDDLPGDGLVPVASALGRHAREALTLDFPEAHQWIAFGQGHLDLLHDPDVYAKLRAWLS